MENDDGRRSAQLADDVLVCVTSRIEPNNRVLDKHITMAADDADHQSMPINNQTFKKNLHQLKLPRCTIAIHIFRSMLF